MAETSFVESATNGGSFDFNEIVKQAVSLKNDDSGLEKRVRARETANERDLARLPDFSKREPPKAPEIAPAPQQQQTNPFQAFGSVASAFGILGSLMTRHPLTTALNASAGAINAIRQNDAAAYKSAYETWEKQSDYAFKLGQFQNEQYKELLANDKLTVDEIISGVRARAAANHDEIALHAARTGDLTAIANIVHARDTLIQNGQLAHERLKVEGDRAQKQFDIQMRREDLMMHRDEMNEAARARHDEILSRRYDNEADRNKALDEERVRHNKEMEDLTRQLRVIEQENADNRVSGGKPAVAAEARGNVAKLRAGQTVEYGGWTFTPADFQAIQNLSNFDPANAALTPKQKALAKMMQEAATPAPVRGQPSAGAPPGASPAAMQSPLRRMTQPQSPGDVFQGKDTDSNGRPIEVYKRGDGSFYGVPAQ